MRKVNNNWTYKGWTIYKAGPFSGFPKKHVLFPPDGSHGQRHSMPTLQAAKRLINGLLSYVALIAREKWEKEWVEIDMEE